MTRPLIRFKRETGDRWVGEDAGYIKKGLEGMVVLRGRITDKRIRSLIRLDLSHEQGHFSEELTGN